MAIVRKEEVIDSWSVLIGGGQGRAEEIFRNTDNFITETKANVRKERKKLAPGIIRGILVLGDFRDDAKAWVVLGSAGFCYNELDKK